jgi:hypothetical protein
MTLELCFKAKRSIGRPRTRRLIKVLEDTNSRKSRKETEKEIFFEDKGIGGFSLIVLYKIGTTMTQEEEEEEEEEEELFVSAINEHRDQWETNSTENTLGSVLTRCINKDRIWAKDKQSSKRVEKLILVICSSNGRKTFHCCYKRDGHFQRS